MKNLNQQEQLELLMYIKETFDNYKILNQERKEELSEIYETYRSFKQKKLADWSSTFKVNKAHELVNKILPRLISKNPRWVVDIRTDEFVDEDKMLTPEQRSERIIKYKQLATWVQDYLTYIFDRYNLKEPIRLWVKNMLIYWNSYARVKYKYETARIRGEWDKISEKIVWEYPTIEASSIGDIYVDPRYILLEDMPAIIEITRNVRLADLKRKKDKYKNIDKIEILPTNQEYSDDSIWSKARIYEITWIPTTFIDWWVDKNTLTLKTFYWKYSFDWEDEKLYRVATINDMIIIDCEEITCIPFEDIKCFDDTETHFSVWIVEPIMGLQDELNFKKNSASEYINQSLNRGYIWSPNSWINPRDIVSRPNNIIPTTKDWITAQNNLIEIPHRQLPWEYFSEQNDIERQIQSQTFTVDTSAQKSNQALTNTATWIRVKFFESNVVLEELRKHYEEALEKLAYKLIETTYENMEDNIIIKKLDDSWFWEMNRELLKDAFNRYSIKVEVNSSSFDDIENRREDAIAFFNILMQWANSWVQVDFTEALKDVIWTFEKRDINKYIKQTNPLDWLGEQLKQMNWWQMSWQSQKTSWPALLTEQVAKWWLTNWL